MLEVERPAILSLDGAGGLRVLVDGVQGWRNPRFDEALSDEVAPR